LKVLHVLFEDINFDYRVKKELNSLKIKHDVEIAYLQETADIYSEIKSHPLNYPAYDKKQLRILYWLKKFRYISKKISAIIKNDNFDVIHVHNIGACFAITLLKPKSKIIYDTHEMYSEMNHYVSILKILYVFIEKYIFKNVDIVIHANESRKDFYVNKFKMKVPNYFIANVTPLSSDFNLEMVSELETLKKTKKIVLYQGAMGNNRNLLEIVKGFAKGKKDKVLVLVGGGMLQKDIKVYIEQNKLSDWFLQISKVSVDKLKSITNYADLGIVTYKNNCLNNYYCASNKLMEYSQQKVPVLGIDFPEIRKTVHTFDIGQVFREEEIESFGVIVDKCLSHASYQQWRNNAHKVIECMNWEKEEEKLEEIYDSIVK